MLATLAVPSTASPPHQAVTYHREHRLLGFVAATAGSPATFTVSQHLIGSDGSRRWMGTVSSNLNAPGVDFLCDLLFGVPEEEEASGPALTPAQKQLQKITNEAIASCCGGVVTVPPCPEFCFGNFYVVLDDEGNLTGSSSFVVCDEGDGCPSDEAWN